MLSKNQNKKRGFRKSMLKPTPGAMLLLCFFSLLLGGNSVKAQGFGDHLEMGPPKRSAGWANEELVVDHPIVAFPGVKIFPGGIRPLLTAEVTGFGRQPVRVMLVDAHGNTVWANEMLMAEPAHRISLDLEQSGLKAGTYAIRVTAANGMEVQQTVHIR